MHSHGCKCSEAGLGKEVKQMHSESDDLKLAQIGLNTRIWKCANQNKRIYMTNFSVCFSQTSS